MDKGCILFGINPYGFNCRTCELFVECEEATAKNEIDFCVDKKLIKDKL